MVAQQAGDAFAPEPRSLMEVAGEAPVAVKHARILSASHQRERISKRAACATGPIIHLIRGRRYRSCAIFCARFSVVKMDQVVDLRPEEPGHPGFALIMRVCGLEPHWLTRWLDEY
jgi:hypothetical protein